MTTQISDFSDGYLTGQSHRGFNPSELFRGQFDLLVLAASWDRRSSVITEALDLHGDYGLLFDFDHRDQAGLCAGYSEKIESFLGSNCKQFSRISGQSENVDEIWERTLEKIQDFRTKIGRPLKVFVDLSVCPRFYALGIVGVGIKTGMIASISVAYSEGVYPDQKTEEQKHEMFTQGGWDAEPIPSFEGQWDPEKRIVYLVSVGFEGSKTLRFVSRREPDRVEVLFPDPPVVTGYAERTFENNRHFFQQYEVREESIIRSDAADGIAAWRSLCEKFPSESSCENWTSLCCGTKPHSLGLALHAISSSSITVLYIVPDRHLETDIGPNGTYWRYDIADLTSIGV